MTTATRRSALFTQWGEPSHHNGHAEVWEAVAADCQSVAFAHSREALAQALMGLGYIAPAVSVFGAEWEHPSKASCIVMHSRAFHRTPETCWVCDRIKREATAP